MGDSADRFAWARSETPAGLVARLREGSRPRPRLAPRVSQDEVALSPSQVRMWFLNRLEAGSGQYNLAAAVSWNGPVDVAALRAAVGDLLARHESLRTVFGERDGRPFQRVLELEDVLVPLALSDVGGDLAAARALCGQLAEVGFDLAVELPLRVHLITVAPEQHELVVVVHESACDGWSLVPLAGDLAAAYQARAAGRAPGWRPLPVSYRD